MGIFTYIFLTSVIFRSADNLEKVLDYVNQMSQEDKNRLLQVLTNQIVNATSSIVAWKDYYSSAQNNISIIH